MIVYMDSRDFLPYKPFHDYSLYSICILPACVLLSVCSLHLYTQSAFYPLSLESAVCSPQSVFYTDRFSF